MEALWGRTAESIVHKVAITERVRLDHVISRGCRRRQMTPAAAAATADARSFLLGSRRAYSNAPRKADAGFPGYFFGEPRSNTAEAPRRRIWRLEISAATRYPVRR